MIRKLISAAAAMAFGLTAAAQITVHTGTEVGPIKLMHAGNNGPVIAGDDQTHGNSIWYKMAEIPYARTHDGSFYSHYGSGNALDIDKIFPDFDSNPKKPSSYDFVNTDWIFQSMISCGTKPFFRMGQKIEHDPIKYGIYPPKNFKKWAQICEHIIMHYNYGWADGHEMGIEYWEIWNEADLDLDTWNTDPKCWGGTKEQFFEFYEVVAKYLKARFPELKIGGPALAWRVDWAEEFLAYMSAHQVPIDFFSWHSYSTSPEYMAEMAGSIHELLVKYGYGDAESILDEWNYVKGWGDEFDYTLNVFPTEKGAAFNAAVIQRCQDAPVDMLMYYDMAPESLFNGVWDLRTWKPTPAYYPFYAWSRLVRYGTQVKSECPEKDVCVTAAKDASGKLRIMVSRYNSSDNVTAPKKYTVTFDSDFTQAYGHLTDPFRTYSEIPLEIKDRSVTIALEPNSFILIDLK